MESDPSCTVYEILLQKKKKTEKNELAYVGNAEHMQKVIKTKFYP